MRFRLRATIALSDGEACPSGVAGFLAAYGVSMVFFGR